MAKKKILDYDYKTTAVLAYRQARDFLAAAEAVDECKLSKPTMVNISFACELYFKAIYIWNNKCQEIVGEHALKELFNMLDAPLQKRIIEETKIDNWERFIDDSSTAFNDWRYVYEKDKCFWGHSGSLFVLATVLDKICEEKIII